MILAIDTSTDTAGVALATDDGGLLGEVTWKGRANHSSLLTPSIEAVLRASGTALRDVTSLAVAIGPGSFSGLRVGISETMGLSMALDIPAVGIGTLDIVGWQVSRLGSPVLAALTAGRGQAYTARYEGQGTEWRRLRGPEILTVTDAVSVGQGALLAGEMAEQIAAAMEERGEAATLTPPAWNFRRPGFLAELGRLHFQSGGSDGRDRLEPLYLRRSAAEEKRGAAQE